MVDISVCFQAFWVLFSCARQLLRVLCKANISLSVNACALKHKFHLARHVTSRLARVSGLSRRACSAVLLETRDTARHDFSSANNAWAIDIPKFHLTRHITSRHDTLSSLCILTQEKVVTCRVARVGQHGATRTSR